MMGDSDYLEVEVYLKYIIVVGMIWKDMNVGFLGCLINEEIGI